MVCLREAMKAIKPTIAITATIANATKLVFPEMFFIATGLLLPFRISKNKIAGILARALGVNPVADDWDSTDPKTHIANNLAAGALVKFSQMSIWGTCSSSCWVV